MLTIEQQNIIDNVLQQSPYDKIVTVDSVAGSGKTFTCHELIKAYKPVNGFYTAFNRAIVQDSTKRFGKDIEAKTIHALAYKYINPSLSIEELNYLSIKEKISYEEKQIVLDTLDKFFRSSYVDVYHFINDCIIEPHLKELVAQYAELMLDGKINPTFNYLLKCMHIMLEHEEITPEFDLLILDEAQDVTGVSLEIFKALNAKHKIVFGDKFQNIYSFMDTVNAFEELKDTQSFKLTKSFRCSEQIASIVERFGKCYLDPNFVFVGTSNIYDDYSAAFISKTNAALIEKMYDLVSHNEIFSLTRSLDDIFALPFALANAAKGNQVFNKQYKYLETEYKKYCKVKQDYKGYYNYIIDTTKNELLTYTISVLCDFSAKHINVYKLKLEALKHIKNKTNTTITTAHAFKGLEASTVYIADDLNRSVEKIHNKYKRINGNTNIALIRDILSIEEKETLNLYYVALSRAKNTLINTLYN